MRVANNKGHGEVMWVRCFEGVGEKRAQSSKRVDRLPGTTEKECKSWKGLKLN